MIFGWVITQILRTLLPIYINLFLGFPILHPVKTHVHWFGAALSHGVVDDVDCTFVVELNWDGTLRMIEFLEGVLHGDCLAGVDECSAGFGLLGG